MAKKILIVEDETDIRNLYSLLMRSTGYEVVEASDGAEALEKFNTTPCEMVITDMNMPRMGGLELISALRNQNPNVYIILITGYGTMETPRKAYNIGTDEYITKPFDTLDLQNRVRAFFQGRATSA
jgi:two-component system chemotaxis response regulator CheY